MSELLKKYWTLKSVLGGGRSEGNCIAQEALNAQAPKDRA